MRDASESEEVPAAPVAALPRSPEEPAAATAEPVPAWGVIDPPPPPPPPAWGAIEPALPAPPPPAWGAIEPAPAPPPPRKAPSLRPENPGPNGPRSTGTIKTKKEGVHKYKHKGEKYAKGVIVPDDGSEEIFYMTRGDGALLKVGQRVSYVQETNAKGPIAHYAEPLADAPLLHGTVTAVKPRNTPTYGFVQPDAGGDDVFVSFVDVESAEGLAVGDRVAYELVPNAGARKSNRTSGEPKYAVKCGHVVVLPKGAAHAFGSWWPKRSAPAAASSSAAAARPTTRMKTRRGASRRR